MDFASALENLEKKAKRTPVSQQQQQQGGRGGDRREPYGRGNRNSAPPHYQQRNNDVNENENNRYTSPINRRRGRSDDEYNNTTQQQPYQNRNNSNSSYSSQYDQHRNQRPRYNNYDSSNINNGNNRSGGSYNRFNHNNNSGNNSSYQGRGNYERPHKQLPYSPKTPMSTPLLPSPSSNPLSALLNFGYNLRPYQPTAPIVPPDRPLHIALLCVCIDKLPYQDLWKAWTKTGNSNSSGKPNVIVSLLCHAKFPEQADTIVQEHHLLRPPRLGRGHSYADPVFMTHSPSWGSVQITFAMIDLLMHALKIGTAADTETNDVRFASKRFLLSEDYNDGPKPPPVDKFIFISETCVPVTTLAECEDALFGDIKSSTSNTKTSENIASSVIPKSEEGNSITNNTNNVAKKKNGNNSNDVGVNLYNASWLNARHRILHKDTTPRNKYESDQFASIHRNIPGQYRWKADQWIVLSRPHAVAIADIDQHLPLRERLAGQHFYKVTNASDEMYFPTVLALLNILQLPPINSNNSNGTTTNTSPEVLLRPVTFTDWSHGARNPTTYVDGVNDLIKVAKLARKQGSLLARKFAPSSPVPDAFIKGNITVDEWKSVIIQNYEPLKMNFDEKDESDNNNSNKNDTVVSTANSKENDGQEDGKLTSDYDTGVDETIDDSAKQNVKEEELAEGNTGNDRSETKEELSQDNAGDDKTETNKEITP